MNTKLMLENRTNDFHKNGTSIWYEVADANWGMYNSNNFTNIKDAKECIKKEYRERNKKDSHDEYWNKKPLVILKITKSTQVVHLDDPNT